METVDVRGLFIIFISFILALMLSILPLPPVLNAMQPQWVLLVLIYWVMALPRQISVGIAFIMGLLVDTLNGQLLGQNALIMTFISYWIAKFHHYLDVQPLWQQAFSLFCLVSLYQLYTLCFELHLGFSSNLFWSHILSIFTSVLLWFWIASLLSGFRVKSRLH